MVAVAPLFLTEEPTQEARLAQHIADLTPEEREKYETNDFFRSLVHTVFEHPELVTEDDAAESQAQSYADGFVAFILKDHSADVAARIAALRIELYGTSFEREVGAIQDGTHPVQQLR